jgi:hypothetical protein
MAQILCKTAHSLHPHTAAARCACASMDREAAATAESPAASAKLEVDEGGTRRARA